MGTKEDVQRARYSCNRCRHPSITMHTSAGFGRCPCGGSLDEREDPPTVGDQAVRDWDPASSDDDDDDDDGEDDL